MQVVRDHLGRDGEQPLEVRDALAEGGQRLEVARGRRCGARPTRARRLRQAERALQLGAARRAAGAPRRRAAARRPGRSRASAAAAAAARARCARRSRRCGCGSGGRGRGRRRRSPASRSRASSSRYAIGSSETLPLVSTSAQPASRTSRWCSGVYGQHHAELARRPARPPAPRARPGAAARARSAAPASTAARLVGASSSTSVARRRDVGDHQRERLVLAVLARAQRGHRAPRRRRGTPGGSRRAP